MDTTIHGGVGDFALVAEGNPNAIARMAPLLQRLEEWAYEYSSARSTSTSGSRRCRTRATSVRNCDDSWPVSGSRLPGGVQSGDGPTISQPWRSRNSTTSRSFIDAMVRSVRCCSSSNPPALAGV